MVLYRELDPHLPDLGWNHPMPLPVSTQAARQIHECVDAAALGAMRGAARSYWAAAGGIALGVSLGAGFALLGWTLPAAVAFFSLAPTSLVTIEARRRALLWQGLIDARLEVLGGVTSSS